LPGNHLDVVGSAGVVSDRNGVVLDTQLSCWRDDKWPTAEC
jgi:hypothetical protein